MDLSFLQDKSRWNWREFLIWLLHGHLFVIPSPIVSEYFHRWSSECTAILIIHYSPFLSPTHTYAKLIKSLDLIWSKPSYKPSFTIFKCLKIALDNGLDCEQWSQRSYVHVRSAQLGLKVVSIHMAKHVNASISWPVMYLSLIHIWRCRRSTLCRSRWSPYH